jgi:hypothetical protein
MNNMIADIDDAPAYDLLADRLIKEYERGEYYTKLIGYYLNSYKMEGDDRGALEALARLGCRKAADYLQEMIIKELEELRSANVKLAQVMVKSL